MFLSIGLSYTQKTARLTMLIGATGLAGLLDLPAATAQSAQATFVPWILNLQQNGYTVEQGQATKFSFNDCTMVYAPVFGSCFGNNPVTPYIVLHPPVSPNGSSSRVI